MSVKLIAVKCPACSADAQIEEGRTTVFCSYCGTQIVLENDNEIIYRHIDEAGVKRAETEQILQLKQMDIDEKKRLDKAKIFKFKIIISIVLGVIALGSWIISAIEVEKNFMFAMIGLYSLIAIAFMWMHGFDKSNDDNKKDENIAKVPTGLDGYTSKNYKAVETILSGAGFTNINCVPMNDLTAGLLYKPGNVSSIVINGHSIYSGGGNYPKDSQIIISYHSFANNKKII